MAVDLKKPERRVAERRNDARIGYSDERVVASFDVDMKTIKRVLLAAFVILCAIMGWKFEHIRQLITDIFSSGALWISKNILPG